MKNNTIIDADMVRAMGIKDAYRPFETPLFFCNLVRTLNKSNSAD
jgi:hypothetical protein